jgi:hypothetical protein
MRGVARRKPLKVPLFWPIECQERHLSSTGEITAWRAENENGKAGNENQPSSGGRVGSRRDCRGMPDVSFEKRRWSRWLFVEPSRAGAAGTGFGVVADEVRNLAQRCARAAEDTASLIEESIIRSKAGKTKLDAVCAIAESAGKATEVVDEVHQASQEQSRELRTLIGPGHLARKN